jgi:hypothetical protein
MIEHIGWFLHTVVSEIVLTASISERACARVCVCVCARARVCVDLQSTTREMLTEETNHLYCNKDVNSQSDANSKPRHCRRSSHASRCHPHLITTSKHSDHAMSTYVEAVSTLHVDVHPCIHSTPLHSTNALSDEQTFAAVVRVLLYGQGALRAGCPG